MYKISEKGNYLQIIAPDGTSYIGAKQEVKVIPNANNTLFSITGLCLQLEGYTKANNHLLNIPLNQLADANNIAFTLQTWETFYQNNTAVTVSSGVGGSSNGLTDAQLRATAIETFTTATELADVTVIGEANQTATVNNILTTTAGVTATDVQRFRSFQIQVNSTATAGTFLFEGSNDNVIFLPIPVKNTSLSSGDAIVLPITATAGSIMYEGPCMFNYLRLRIVTPLTGGSVQAVSIFSGNSYAGLTQIVGQSVASNNKMQASQAGTWTVMPGNTANTTPWLMNVSPSTSFGYSSIHQAKNTAGNTLLASVKASAGNINFVTISNAHASAPYFLKIYNKASAPTLASDVPSLIFRVPPATIVTIPCRNLRLTTGIAYAVTGGVADTDTTAIATANDIIVNINYV